MIRCAAKLTSLRSAVDREAKGVLPGYGEPFGDHRQADRRHLPETGCGKSRHFAASS